MQGKLLIFQMIFSVAVLDLSAYVSNLRVSLVRASFANVFALAPLRSLLALSANFRIVSGSARCDTGSQTDCR